MKKKALSLVITLMSLSLLGLIGLQAYWVRHAIQVKEEQFDRSVNDALNQVVHQLEVQELAAGLQKHLVALPPEPIPASPPAPAPEPVPVAAVAAKKEAKPATFLKAQSLDAAPVKVEKASDKIIILQPEKLPENVKIYRNISSSDSEKLRRLLPGNQTNNWVHHPDSIRKKIFYHQRLQHTTFDSLPFAIRLNHDSIFKLLNADRMEVLKEFEHYRVADSILFKRRTPRSYTVRVKADSLLVRKKMPEKRQTAKPVNQPVRIETEVLKRKEKQVNQVVEKMVMEMVTKEIPLQKRLNFAEVDSMVASALADKNIDLPYAVAIAAAPADSLLHLKQINTAFQRNQPNYKVSLFPNDLVKKPEYLMLQFPDKQQYVMGSVWPMLSASAVFTLIIMLTFGATLGFIFRQKKISEIKSDFINNMTHEFKTPIATISLATDAIKSPKVLADQNRVTYYTSIIKQENERMLSQVENVLQMALLDKQNLNLNFEKINLDLLLQQAMDKLKLQIESREGELIFTSGTQRVQILADPLHLENVFLNLLDNANKYSPEKPLITVKTRLKNGKVFITIDDEGIGMSAEVQKKVFEKFYRVPTGNLHNVKGFGLGLAYVKAITEQHKGQVSVKSSPGKGSTFEICLPVYKV